MDVFSSCVAIGIALRIFFWSRSLGRTLDDALQPYDLAGLT